MKPDDAAKRIDRGELVGWKAVRNAVDLPTRRNGHIRRCCPHGAARRNGYCCGIEDRTVGGGNAGWRLEERRVRHCKPYRHGRSRGQDCCHPHLAEPHGARAAQCGRSGEDCDGTIMKTLDKPAPGRSCGSCTMCCKVLGIKELAKPVGKWCSHCDIGKGCKIYDTRPQECQTFHCLWLVDNRLADHWKPDRSKIVITTGWNGNSHGTSMRSRATRRLAQRAVLFGDHAVRNERPFDRRRSVYRCRREQHFCRA